jgi:hypothetical protein
MLYLFTKRVSVTFAFEIGKAFSDERRRYRCGWYFGQSEGREFIDVAAG